MQDNEKIEINHKIELINVEDIIPYTKNQKKHPKEQLDKIRKSIVEFGFNVPLIIDEKNVIITGHGRFIIAKQIGMSKVPCIRLNNLTESQVKMFRIADNKVAESEWDLGLLREEFQSLSLDDEGFNVESSGFDMGEVDELLGDTMDHPDDVPDKIVDQLSRMMVTCPECGCKFSKGKK